MTLLCTIKSWKIAIILENVNSRAFFGISWDLGELEDEALIEILL